MSPTRIAPAAVLAGLLAASTLLSGAATAQTANGSPTAPASPGLVGTPPPVSRTAPSTRGRGAKPDAASSIQMHAPPKPTKADIAEQKKLEHDLHICIGC